MDIFKTLTADGNFNTIVKLIKAADFEKTLSSQGPYTVFFPSDGAFEEISTEKILALLSSPQQKLKDLLFYHVVEGKHTAAELAKEKSIKTLARYLLDITFDHGLKVDGVRVVEQDIVCDNGILHIVNGLMAP